MVIISSYHHATADEHQKNFNGLANGGYYPISLSVQREGNVPYYAAVWGNQGMHMPPWVTFYGLSSKDYGEFLETRRKEGFAVSSISCKDIHSYTSTAVLCSMKVRKANR
jgi:hypothetical protein